MRLERGFVYRMAIFATFLVLLATATHCSPPPPAVPHRLSNEEEVDKLRAIARDKKLRETDPERVIEALERLAVLGDDAATKDLVNFLTFKKAYPWETDPSRPIDAGLTGPASRYPAVGALMNIGDSCVPTLLKVIETHDPSSLESRNSMDVITYLSRDKRQKYIQELRKEATEAPSPLAAERLLTAAETLEHTKR
jgi:hypothetical protein